MDARSFLGLQPTHNAFRWHLPVTTGITSGVGALFGGAALGAGIAALESTTGRPCVWASAQYLSYAHPPDVVDIDVTIGAEGHQITQARATCHVGNREIITVNAALGSRDFDASGQFQSMPDVVPPEQCAPREMRADVLETSIASRLDMRAVMWRPFDDRTGVPSNGRTIVWARMPELNGGLDAAALAVLGDWVPMACGQALGIMGGGNSLDNTLRIGNLVASDWVLLDIQISMVANGFGHGSVNMWAQDGTFLAVASQSVIVRYFERMRGAPPEPAT